MEGIEHELHKMEWHLMKTWHKTPEIIERVFNEKNLEGLNGVVEKINNEKNKLVVDLSKTTQNLRWNYTTTNVWIAEKNEEMQNSTSKEIRIINCTSRREKKRYLNSIDKNLDELLKKWIKS